MKKNKFSILALIAIWVAFISWEIVVQQWAKQISGPIIRVDLVIILPVLIVLTVFIIFQLNKKTNS